MKKIKRSLLISAVGCALYFMSPQTFAQSYWQQKVDYVIQVKLDDKAHTLSAFETIQYTNNSPNQLDSLMFHLWPNAYKNGKTALAKQLYNDGEQLLQFGKEEDKGFIDSLDFQINGAKINWKFDQKNPDIAVLYLPNKLASGGKITISTPFKVKIPSGEISRLGHIGQSYQITQWFPKPAVYDKNGWNAIPYLNQGEFYSEYGTFDVSITLPANYVVGATGDLQTASEIEFLNKKADETSGQLGKYTTSKSATNVDPESSTEWKTIRYTQKDVHDFAWFADKKYLVLKGEVELPASKRKVTTWAMFTPKNAYLWKKAIEYINDGTYFYSLWNGDYPYNQVTAVDGTISAGGGMEYPNVTVIGNTSSAAELEIVIVHEVGHNWFYGILGSNERVHGWMDEGMNTLNELRYMYTKYPNNTNMTDMVRGELFHLEGKSHYDLSEISFISMAKIGEDQPIETHSADFTSANYGAVMYMKTGLVFNYLKAYLGDELFDKCMHAYFETWKFKHPQPEDMKSVLERESGKDLSWLFGDLIQTTDHVDFKIGHVKSKNGATELTVKNKGQVNGPVQVTAFKENKEVFNTWVFPNENNKVTIPSEVDAVVLDNGHRIPEMNKNNNRWHKDGLFGHAEPLKVEFMLGDHESDKNNVFWTPAFGANAFDRFMLGVSVHNIGIPTNNFQYLVAPMYSFGRKNVSGIAEFSYGFYPKSILKTSRFGLSVKSFKLDEGIRPNDAYYVVAQPYWTAKLGNRKAASPSSQSVKIQGLYRLDKFGPSQQELVGGFGTYDYSFDRPDHQVKFQLRADYLANAVNGDNLSRGMSEMCYRYRYLKDKKKRFVELRVFAGTTFNFDMYNSGDPLNYTMALSGSNGLQDVFVEDYFFNRSGTSGFFGNQRLDNQGGFKNTSDFGSTIGWMTSANFYSQLPVGPSFLGVYANYGFFQTGLTKDVLSAYEAGLAIRAKKFFGVYFPLVMSKELNDSYGGAKYGEKIRLTLQFNIANKPLSLSGIL